MQEAFLEAPFGSVRIQVDDEGVVQAVQPRTLRRKDSVPAGFPVHVVEAIRAYLRDGSAQPDLPVALPAEGFAGKVLDAMRRIPPGEVATYGDLAAMLGSPGAARAVGNACAQNPVPLVVPCHRVVGASGLGGYSGGGLEVKKWLLAHEGVAFKD